MPFVSLRCVFCNVWGPQMAAGKGCTVIEGVGAKFVALAFGIQVGKIKDITQSGRAVKVQMAWFYRPEEAQGGRKVWLSMWTAARRRAA
jgi:hypothetical protein